MQSPNRLAADSSTTPVPFQRSENGNGFLRRTVERSCRPIDKVNESKDPFKNSKKLQPLKQASDQLTHWSSCCDVAPPRSRTPTNCPTRPESAGADQCLSHARDGRSRVSFATPAVKRVPATTSSSVTDIVPVAHGSKRVDFNAKASKLLLPEVNPRMAY